MDALRDRHAAGLRSPRPAAGRDAGQVLKSFLASRRAVLKEDRCFAVSATNGNMTAASPDGHGLWLGDTRMLSDFRLLVDGREPQVTGLRDEAGSLAFELANGDVHVLRERYVDHGLHERITFTNRGSAAIRSDIELEFSADFAAMLAIRGAVRDLPPYSATAAEVVIRPDGRRHQVDLRPHEPFSLVIDVPAGVGATASDFDAGLARMRDSYRSWASDSASFETDNATLNELIEQSRNDMRMLLDRYPTGIYPTGGTPWFAVPFGRDALITSSFVLPMNPTLARGALRYLAAHQGRRADPATEEEPGKILHEVRDGEVVEKGLWPHILYGTVDATPLYVCVVADTVDWTGDSGLLDELWPNVEAALGWCETSGDKDGDGYIEYQLGVEARNEGWKDSNDSLTNVDGTDVSRPAALCEVQGYLYRAMTAMAGRRPELKTRAAGLRRRFNRDFWLPREKFIAQALDGSKRKVEALTSNPGHCLWTGILPKSRSQAVAARLVSPEMFSGWGVRTLSNRAVNYDPCSYHNGSVWPHDCAIAAAGMRAAGLTREAELVARTILEAGMAFADRRLPELWCGGDRTPGSPPDDYRNSCSPQNWAAASTFSLLTTLLGLKPDARQGRLHISPVETALWKRLEVNGLHFAGHRIDFAVDGRKVKLGALPRGIQVGTR